MVDKLQEMEVKLEPILQLFELPDVAEQMKKDDSNIFEYLTNHHKVCMPLSIPDLVHVIGL